MGDRVSQSEMARRLGVTEKAAWAITYELTVVNGLPGMLMYANGALYGVVTTSMPPGRNMFNMFRIALT